MVMESIDSSSLAVLCQKCQQIIDSWFRRLKQDIRSHYEFDIGHYANIFDLEQSAHKGCGLCARFVGSISSLGLEILQQVQTRDIKDGLIKNRISVDDTGSKEWLLSSYFNPPVLDEKGFPVAPCVMLMESNLGM
jgi:hypothetical protein